MPVWQNGAMTWINRPLSEGVRRRVRLSSREIALAVLITVAAVVALSAAIGTVIPDNHPPVASMHGTD